MATHGASSSSVVSLGKYDVFLSFRGEDTRKNFTSHLYNALEEKQIKTFIDNEELKKGDELSPELMKAIEESLASIVIFSENYATSKWCLKEFVKILDCRKNQGQIVIPVFYNMDPSHVRNQTGSYEKAFKEHEKDLKLNKDQLEQWKAALTKSANLIGWDSRERNESDLIKDIVGDISRKLKYRYSFEVKGLVGIEKNRHEIESLLEIGSDDVRIVGIWGMGGVGKTTLAKAVCTKLCSQFEGCCFLENVREELETHGLKVVRQRLFSLLLQDENLRVDAPFVENSSFMTKLARTKVFVVLDNVETLQQIQGFLINNIRLGPGSRVIVTTRDRHICSQFDKSQVYKLENLNPEDSLELFCLNAFRKKHPKVGYEELSKRVIAYCNGNPLALRVLGANLKRFESKVEWKSELEKLQKIQDVNIHKVLKMSYDVLDRNEKNIFLDIACFKFFRHWQMGKVTSLLDACGFSASSGIRVLQDKALITISSDDNIEMHDLIEGMGQEIVNQEPDPGKRSRLWKNEEVNDVLNNNKGTDAVEGIHMIGDRDLEVSSNSFKGMTNLRYLEILGIFKFRGDELGCLSNKLRYLRWDAFPFKSLPSTFSAKNLVELRMYGGYKLRKLWDGAQNLKHLKEISLDFCTELIEIPDLSEAPMLEKVSLAHCKSLCLRHPSILSLPKLSYLNLRHCEKIESLNIRSKSLQKLDLSYCSSLTEFSVTSKKMTWLSLRCTAIHELSSSIWQHSKLTYLCLRGCDKLNTVGKKKSNDPQLGSVTELDLSACTQLDTLNLSFILDAIQSLESLLLNGCHNLEALPDNIQNHSKLVRLELDEHLKPLYPPSGLGWWSDGLRFLKWRACHLEHLPSKFFGEMLVELYMPRSKLKKLWDGVQIFVNLKIIDLKESEDLLEIPDLLMVPKLEKLDLYGCRKIKYLTSNIHLKYLRDLCLDRCSSLIECSVTSEEMTNLSLSHTAIRELSSSIWRNSKLFYLNLSGCDKLNMVEKKLSNDPRLGSLTKLNLSGCPQMDALNLSFILDAIQSLKWLKLNGCRNLKALPDNIQNHSKLRGLALDECRKLVFPPTQLPPSLRVLSAANCAYLDTDSVLRLMLENVFQNIKNMLQNMTSERHDDDVDDDDDDAVVVVDDDDVDDDDDDDDYDDDDYYDDNGIFLLSPGAQVPVGIFNFQTTEASITTHPISTSGLHAFIFCIVLSEGVHLDGYLQFVFYENNKEVKIDHISCPFYRSQTLKSDHVLLGRRDYKYNKQESGGDHCNISFQFDFQHFSKEENKWSTKGINGCGIIPVYALKHGSDLCMPSITTSSIREEIVEQVSHDESDQHLEIDNDGLQPRKVGVSTKENQDEKQPFSSSRSCDDKEEEEEEEEEELEDLNVKSSCCCSIGLLSRHLLGGSNQ